MVNIENLTNELNGNGTIVILGENNGNSFIIVMDNVSSDIVIMKDIIDSYLLNEYPNILTFTLYDNVLKCEYQK